MMRPFTMTGYGSASNFKNGAAVCTRSLTSRMYSTRELLVTWPETNRFQSPNRSASAALRKKLDTLTPAAPVYFVSFVVVAFTASCSATFVSTTA
jgi:hypothetical protein